MYPQTRKKAMKAKKVNLKFFPEGGNLVKGVPSQVAFEATDAYGNPITLFGRIILDRVFSPQPVRYLAGEIK
jgi:hypothetical protein